MTRLKHSGVEKRFVDIERSLPVGVEKSNNRLAAVAELAIAAEPIPKTFLPVEFEMPVKLLVDEANLFGVLSLVFVKGNFVLLLVLANGDAAVAENPVFKISFCVSRNRSRNSHADCCLTSVGRRPADNFFVVLNVARAGLIGVVVPDGVEHFIVDELVGFEIFAFGVYFEDIFSPSFQFTYSHKLFLFLHFFLSKLKMFCLF